MFVLSTPRFVLFVIRTRYDTLLSLSSSLTPARRIFPSFLRIRNAEEAARVLCRRKIRAAVQDLDTGEGIRDDKGTAEYAEIAAERRPEFPLV
ncbi:Hypothetical protein NTJ_13597 [Nesidiocoris tenuis]|uniref:Uncharacterized protein n=1 Tax=Nesidiocoris tenuis TaxID=355587 RepID=A0ABN7B8R5_9HEMI|nr:Hypothetical protein NTJ_13597 [Nesidiocoris tenuis]